MRLRKIKKILSDNIDKLRVSATLNQTSATYNLVNLNSLREGIKEIEKAGLFIKDISIIKNISLFASTIDNLQISNQDYSSLVGHLGRIISGAELLIESINHSQPNIDSENIVSIKLPEHIDFDSLGKIIDLLKKSISIPLADSEVSDSIEINAFESGSFWIDILVHSKEAISLIGAITWAATYIHKKKLEAKIHFKYIESLGVKNENLKDLKETAKKQMDLLIEAEAQNIENQFHASIDYERLKRLELSIKSMSELIEKHVEVHPNLLATKDIVDMFPSLKNIGSVESKIKKIDKQ